MFSAEGGQVGQIAARGGGLALGQACCTFKEKNKHTDLDTIHILNSRSYIFC